MTKITPTEITIIRPYGDNSHPREEEIINHLNNGAKVLLVTGGELPAVYLKIKKEDIE